MQEDKRWYKRYTSAERMELAHEIFRLSSLVFKNWKIQKTVSLEEACEAVWLKYITFNTWVKSDPMIKDAYEAYNINRLAQMKWQAKTQVEKALFWEMKLKDIEKVNIALRFLEKVDEDFKDKKEIKVTWEIDFNKSIDDLEAQAKALLWDIKANAIEEESGDKVEE